jgi:ADP-ribose pyrophosphatase YjhB (NUDIX family)
MNSSFSTVQRYRVFLNDKLILISEDINIADYQPSDRVVNFNGLDEMLKEYERFKGNEDCERLIFHANNRYSEACESFSSLFRKIKAAGGLVRNPDGNILFIFRLGAWDLPKGKLKKNEGIEEGALREVTEETGLSSLRIIYPLPSTYHIYTDRKGRACLKETYWFEMMYEGVEIPVPQTEEDITEVRWFEPNNLGLVLDNTYASLREMILGYQL